MNQVSVPQAERSVLRHSGFRRQTRAIQSALLIVAKIIGRKLNVEVRVGGEKSRRDGAVIHLPTLPFDDPDVETLAFGYVQQQAARVRYSQPVEPESPAHTGLWEIIDAVRSERNLGTDYPGFADTLKKLMSKLVENGYLKAPQDSDSPSAKLGHYLLYRLRAELLEQSGLQDYATQAELLFRQSFPESACVRIGSVIGRAQGVRSSQEALMLAGEILGIADEESQEPPPPPPSSPSQDEKTGAEARDNSAGGNSSNDADKAKRDNLRQVLAAGSTDMGQDVGKLTGEALNRAAAEAAGDSGGAGIGRAEIPISEPKVDPAQVLAEVSAATIALSTRIRSFVESHRHVPMGYKRKGNRPDPRRYVRALCGDLKVFKRQQLAPEINTAAVLLLDRSGSMKDRMEVAIQSTLAAAGALASIKGIAIATGAFPGRASDVELLTRFSESVKRTAHRYKGVTPSGGTPLLPALLWAADELLTRPEPRKMLLVITDGEPAHLATCQDGIARCWRGGIEAYGIGIRVPDIRNLFPISRSIETLEQLAPAVFEMLQDALTKNIAA